MTFMAILQRIAGTSPEITEQQVRFEKNMESTRRQLDALDALRGHLDGVIQRVTLTQKKVVSSTHSSNCSGEHILHLPEMAVDGTSNSLRGK